MSETRWIIHFSGDDWWQSNPHSRHHITEQFYRSGYHVLWINPMGLRFPSIQKKGFAKKVANKFRSLFKALRKDRDGFYVYTFVFLPVFKRGLAERINTMFVNFQIGIVMRRLGIGNAVGFVTLPTFAPMVSKMKKKGRFDCLIYYYSDQYDHYREIRDRGPILEWDAMLQEDADAIYCASQAILDNVAESVRKKKIARVIDHQVDFDAFDYTRLKTTPLDIAPPVIGYFGSLTDSNDWEMIKYAAARHAEWNFVFIGRKKIDVPDLEELPNIHFMGFVPYQDLPAVAANFSVGIMFWKMTDWIRACSPLKLKEYLALGIPVVSVPIDEVVEKYRDYVEIASDGPSFVTAVEKALEKGRCREYRDYAAQFSWQSAVRGIMQECRLV